MDVGDLRQATLAPLVGESFTVHGVPAELNTLVLDSVIGLEATPGAPRQDPFTLTFVGPAGGHLTQTIHTLEHPTIGEIGIFLVPLGPGPDGRHRYEAVFN